MYIKCRAVFSIVRVVQNEILSSVILDFRRFSLNLLLYVLNIFCGLILYSGNIVRKNIISNYLYEKASTILSKYLFSKPVKKRHIFQYGIILE